MNDESAPPGADAIASALADQFVGSGPVVVHAGHFALFLAPSRAVLPTVESGHPSEPLAEARASNPILAAWNQFSLSSLKIGAGLVQRLKARGTDAALIVLVNDWQFLRQRQVPDAAALRHSFYQSHPVLFPSYQAILNKHDLSHECVLGLHNTSPFISEYRLRRQIERKLKRLAKSHSPAAKHLSIERDSHGDSHLMYDDFGRACRILMCGQSDCAGEVMQLISMLHERSLRNLINIIPAECTIPVTEGTRRAIQLFELADFQALNLSLPCLAGNDARPTANRIIVEPTGESDEIEASVNLHSF